MYVVFVCKYWRMLTHTHTHTQSLATMLSVIPLAARGPAQIIVFDIHALQERFYFSDQVIPRSGVKGQRLGGQRSGVTYWSYVTVQVSFQCNENLESIQSSQYRLNCVHLHYYVPCCVWGDACECYKTCGG